MDYKAEVLVNRTIVYSFIYRNYSHPNQVAKLIIKKFKARYDYFTIFIMNTFGEIWSYGVEKTPKGQKAWQLMNDMKSKREALMVFSGNLSIIEASGGGI